MTVETLPDPVCGPGEVLVRVRAFALNFFDTLIIEGKYQLRPEMPFSPSAEFSGVVEAVGDGVERFAPGDAVIGYVRYGAARDLVVAVEDDLVALPDGISFEAAAGLSVTYGTTLHAFRDRAGLKPGERVAVLGAAGGVGQAAVEIGVLMGAEVIACASSDDKLAFARSLGAAHTINYDSESLKDRLKALTGGEGVDVVYDPVGGELAEQALRATAWQGRFLVVGFASGTIPKIPLNLVLLKGCDIRGVFWGESIVRDPEGHWANMAQILDWVRQGRLNPHIHAVYPLDQTAEALAEIAGRSVRGKVIVTP
ncbi:Oxidoreductase, zinc-binding dehydrogenase family [Polymorphum gilvum SL003B-26A1]|uniref:Oxidoreductase, zinc-binding dehydrogenase family n=1 Tax=Polymorphum gilvum (strain LMG 25793 / CGMCC 1.9160 / SL003B-26A1) TaxID=991905 RepID=F2J078_POLGS|nr:zinc-binding dehydrogenase [Polymorphum gilvum]ADZ68613.1 Oxidoreductase, zinc-binding dehydrogenase family [Polymorphum gilvum SL003B-26A1]